MFTNMLSLSDCVLDFNGDKSVAIYNKQVINKAQFYSDVQSLSAVYSAQKSESVAVYYEQAYPFCVNFFALLHAGKKVWVAANNKQIMAEQLAEEGCLLVGDWQGKEASLLLDNQKAADLKPLDTTEQNIVIFTSGSSGQPKAISKSLDQFQREIETLESCWGELIGDATVLGTVSHQHIYGLLFRVLWPLSARRCFDSEMYLSPEPLLKVSNKNPAIWVASPAQLKRLDDLTSWEEVDKLKGVFSSGGALPLESAKQIAKHCRHSVVEIYGSSETGGIAWRQSEKNEAWKPFNNITLSVDDKGVTHLSSPYVKEEDVTLDDRINITKNGCFTLLGRMDRIVKIEEKRLSLDSLENRLNSSEWVEKSYALLLSGKRDKVAVTLVLTPSGDILLNNQGRAALIKQLKQVLLNEFESVVLPRKWLFMSELPLTAQGKINQGLLTQLFSLKNTHSPQIISCRYQHETVELQLRIQPDLVYFVGHFPDQPILPGVTQLAWAEQFGKIFFDIKQPFLRMEVVKFKKVIQPNSLITMTLNWKADTEKLYFELVSIDDTHSSGRIVYGEQE